MVKCNNCKNLETKDNGFDAYSWCEKINDCPHEDIIWCRWQGDSTRNRVKQ